MLNFEETNNILSTDQIFELFLNNSKFNVIYREALFPIKTSSININKNDVVEVLLGMSSVGTKTIAFFHKIPRIQTLFKLRAPLLFITRLLPEHLEIPTIFIKNLDNLIDLLNIAEKTSMESNLPVNVVLSPNVFNNISKNNNIEREHSIIKPYLSSDSLKKFDFESLYEHLQLSEAILSNFFKNIELTDELSFYENNKSFIPYIVPNIKNKFIEKIAQSTFKIPNEEKYFFNKLSLQFNINLKFEIYEKRDSEVDTKSYLCPGCPFVPLKGIVKNYQMVFSDIPCSIIQNLFNVKFANFNEYYGLTYERTQLNTLYIGNISNINNHFINNLKPHQKIILLADNETYKINNLPLLKKLFKAPATNFIFPYSCENIPHKKSATIKEKKCKCLSLNEKAKCIENTYCPALFYHDNKVFINSALCIGCNFCKEFCPYGAIR
ncbi:4Fe-4S binding protein [Deferribacter thermophilus]|uniref:indolepyruvate ferredoxin oxidoreductase subunit alpha n=1 Tax=Deferribacter thermophilus TaxID=53573 RepID=UPI003C15FE42